MLKIAIHHHDRAPSGMSEAGAKRGLMAEIAAEGDVSDGFIARGKRADFGNRGIGRAVVDKDDLEAAKRARDLRQAPGHARDVACLIVGRQYERQIGLRCIHGS
jgi:hypothetical protein